MQSVLSRNQQPSSTFTSRSVKKSTSFLSLRREKDNGSSSSNVDAAPPLPQASASSYMRSMSYFEQYPRPKSSPASRSSNPKVNARPSPKTASPATRHSSAHDTYDKARTRHDTAYAFPTFDSVDDLPTPKATSDTFVRARSRTGPSGKSNWDEVLNAPHLRFSGSSSTQHTETPPRTPVDYSASRDSLEQFPVVVSAPVSGVETMDALVDGMNGGDFLGRSTRSRYGIPNHHPLYQPPLPTPPPGIVLGGGKARRPKVKHTTPHLSESSGEDDNSRNAANNSRKVRRRRPGSSRTISNSTVTTLTSAPFPAASSESVSGTSTPRRVKNDISRVPSASSLPEKAVKPSAPSISEIIRAHAPKEAQIRMKPSTVRSASLHNQSRISATVERVEVPITQADDGEVISRSSLDSIADEVQQTLKNQEKMKPVTSVPPSSYLKHQSIISDNASIFASKSDGRAPTPSIYSSAASFYQPASPLESSFLSTHSPAQAVAQYLRSSRLTRLLKLTRSPHASADNPLTVSLSDLGSSTGYPVVVFLGLGCVRHIMGLYDEMAECMGLRLITIDRWGLGRTEPRHKSAKGIMQWANVVEEVLDLMGIEKCSIMAHSAGAPYALSFANKVPHRIHGDVCLLAPWVGGSESTGYKWLKYVPNGILKTAQAAEWRIQAWMIGKPPTISYEGIGYTPSKDTKHTVNLNNASPIAEGKPRPSFSSTFSDYDDLRDFEGRFESRSTIGADSWEGTSSSSKRKPSKGFLDRLKGSSHSEEKSNNITGKTLKGLRSMGSLKGKNRSGKSEPPSPVPPFQFDVELGLGLDEEYALTKSIEVIGRREDGYPRPSTASQYSRAAGYRSMSFSSPKRPTSIPSSPVPSTVNSTFTASVVPNSSYQAALGSALIAASHAESSKGTHNDLLQILNHDNHPWGFSYSSYPHNVRMWYGDKDEKIAENAVRWMERTMGPDKCNIKLVRGADHGLMYRSSVVVEVFEKILSTWKSGSH